MQANYTDILIEEYDYTYGKDFECIDKNFLYKYKGKDSHVIIPEGITSICAYAFAWQPQIESITIPNTVKSIVNNAFDCCINLKTINLPQSLTSLGDTAFCHCHSLSEIIIPDSITQLKFAVFAHCESLTKVVLPKGLTKIGSNAFQDCINLSNINIPNSLTSIERAAFMNCTSLTKLDLSNTNITKIEDLAFADCFNLTSLIFPACLEKTGTDIIDNCEKLTQIYLPDNIINIAPFAHKTACKIITRNWSAFMKLISFDTLSNTSLAKLNPDVYDNFPYYKEVKKAITNFDLTGLETQLNIFIAALIAMILKKPAVYEELLNFLVQGYSKDEIKKAIKAVVADKESIQIVIDKLNSIL